MRNYSYTGAVYVFNKLMTLSWTASTYAASDAKAISNLKYRFRKYAGVNTNTPITFTGTLTVN